MADQADQVLEEGQLLAHQRAVDAVLARDLAEQPAQLRAAGARVLRLGRRQQGRDPLERDCAGHDAQRHAGAAQQRHALLLQAPALRHLGLDVRQPRKHGVGAALTMARGWTERPPRVGFLLAPPYFPLRVSTSPG